MTINTSFNFEAEITSKTATSLTITLDPFNSTGSYLVTKQKVLNDSNEGLPVTTEHFQNPINLDQLDSGYTYNVSIEFKKGSESSEIVIMNNIKLNENSFNGKMVSGNKTPTKISASKQYMDITQVSGKDNEWALAYKSFNAIKPVAALSGTKYKVYPVDDNAGYYAFGTSLYLGSITGRSIEAGGLGFFFNEDGTSGYILFIETVQSSAAKDRKAVRILKATPEKLIVLSDSQNMPTDTFAALYSAHKYDLDVKVKVSGNEVYIDAYINGFLVTAVDRNDQVLKNSIIGPTSKMALCVNKGTILFDYVYGSTIQKAMYESQSYATNFYTGQFSNDVIQSGYGNIVYDAMAQDDQINTDFINKNEKAIDEFGTVVREIVHVKQKFDQRPAYPMEWSVGNNRYTKVIGSTRSSFGGEAYVLNNSSSTIPLADGSNLDFYCYGNSIGQSGQLEYSTDETSEYAIKEPVIFESNWLQNESDVKNLANWIKTHIVNRGKIVTMSVFGNPVISVGDIVTINYGPQNLTGTAKFLVTEVSHSFSEGIDTTLTCRTL